MIEDRSAVELAAHPIDIEAIETLEVVGPTVQILTPPSPDEDSPCLIRGTIPPGGLVPLHSHPEPETFVAISGSVEGLAERGDGYGWVPVGPGDVFHVPGDARHAWRNGSEEPSVNLIVTTERIARFFREIGTPVDPRRRTGGVSASPPPPPEAIERLQQAAERFGHWTGTAEENAAIGLSIPG